HAGTYEFGYGAALATVLVIVQTNKVPLKTIVHISKTHNSGHNSGGNKEDCSK
ncbi:unnamed protein product, partial [marine sediment metagenome]